MATPKTLFQFNDYRQYLQHALPTAGPLRGSRVKLAETLNVQKGWISAVLGGSADLTLEHAFKVSRFLAHTDEEREYFLLLIQYARAGSRDLKSHFHTKVLEISTKRREIRERIHPSSKISEHDQITYYSSWHYAAIHMCFMIPSLRTPESIARYTGIPIERVKSILEFFLRTGVAGIKDGAYVAGQTRIHIGSESPFISKHHSNWRMRAIHALDRSKKENLHYSSAMSLSKDAAEKIREILLQSIQSTEPIIKEAKDECVYALTMDWFEITS